MQLEKMDAFFNARHVGYEEHQLTVIQSAKEFYKETAHQLPTDRNAKVLDLGCGTGLELEEFYSLNPMAQVTGIDMAEDMLKTLNKKFSEHKPILIHDSYFDVPFGESEYDAAVSVESLHHFTKEQKIPLYQKLHRSLKETGYFILTDYIIEDEEQENKNFEDFTQLKKEQGIKDGEFYHYDTPLTREHEIEALRMAGFSKVEVLNQWGDTQMLKAYK